MKLKTANIDTNRRIALALPVAALAIYWLRRRDDPPLPPIDVKEVLAAEAQALIAAGALIVDVRYRAAYEAKHIAGAVLAELGDIERAVPISLAASKAMPIVVYCADGHRSGPAGTLALNKAGFTKAVNLAHGLEGWVAAGLPVEAGVPKA